MQLELPFMVELPPENKIEECEYKVNGLKDSYQRLRRGLWASNGDLKRRCSELEERLWILERNLCKN